MNTYALQQSARTLEATAAEAKRLALELDKLQSPIGEAILEIAATLARHGLCVISRAALKDVAELLETVPADGYGPWPAGMYASVAAVQETLDRVPA